MKKSLTMILVLVIVMLTGCSIAPSNNPTTIEKTLKSLDMAYSEGEHVMQGATCSGYITNGQTEVSIAIPVSKRILENQNVELLRVETVALRTVNGSYLYGPSTDLTQYIESAEIRNDGAVLFIHLVNPEKWLDSNGNSIANNTPLTGFLDVSFKISNSFE